MSFAAPIGLLALLVIPAGFLLARALRHRRRRHALRFPAAASLAAVVPSVSAWRRRVPPALLALAAAALALALAKPQKVVAVPVERATIMLVMDASRSMLSIDVEPTRMDAAKRAANRFVDQIPKQLQVGMVGFNTTPYIAEGPTTDHDRVRSALDSLQADGGTATGEALKEAFKRLRPKPKPGQRQEPAPAAIVLLSDGKSTDGEDPVTVARRIGKAGIPIFTIALGTTGGVVPGPFGQPLSVPPDPESMRQIATVSRGRSFVVGDSDRLRQIYSQLGSRVGTKNEEREITASFAGAGLVLLLAAAALSVRWRSRVA
jgi:Ca-activated chloride channel homolog